MRSCSESGGWGAVLHITFQGVKRCVSKLVDIIVDLKINI
jgi:hypothetical protein